MQSRGKPHSTILRDHPVTFVGPDELKQYVIRLVSFFMSSCTDPFTNVARSLVTNSSHWMKRCVAVGLEQTNQDLQFSTSPPKQHQNIYVKSECVLFDIRYWRDCTFSWMFFQPSQGSHRENLYILHLQWVARKVFLIVVISPFWTLNVSLTSLQLQAYVFQIFQVLMYNLDFFVNGTK